MPSLIAAFPQAGVFSIQHHPVSAQLGPSSENCTRACSIATVHFLINSQKKSALSDLFAER